MVSRARACCRYGRGAHPTRLRVPRPPAHPPIRLAQELHALDQHGEREVRPPRAILQRFARSSLSSSTPLSASRCTTQAPSEASSRSTDRRPSAEPTTTTRRPRRSAHASDMAGSAKSCCRTRGSAVRRRSHSRTSPVLEVDTIASSPAAGLECSDCMPAVRPRRYPKIWLLCRDQM